MTHVLVVKHAGYTTRIVLGPEVEASFARFVAETLACFHSVEFLRFPIVSDTRGIEERKRAVNLLTFARSVVN